MSACKDVFYKDEHPSCCGACITLSSPRLDMRVLNRSHVAFLLLCVLSLSKDAAGSGSCQLQCINNGRGRGIGCKHSSSGTKQSHPVVVAVRRSTVPSACSGRRVSQALDTASPLRQGPAAIWKQLYRLLSRAACTPALLAHGTLSSACYGDMLSCGKLKGGTYSVRNRDAYFVTRGRTINAIPQPR